MSNRHAETLATYTDIGNVYSYGYGALREACRLFEEGHYDHVQFTAHWHAIVAGVEFRAAELAADILVEDLRQDRAIARERFRPAEEPPTAIYVSDENAAERPKDE